MTDYNLEQIAKDCFINRSDDSALIISKIDDLANKINCEDFVDIMNYFFQISNNYQVVMHLLKLINKHKSKSSVPYLVDALILKDEYKNKFKDDDNQVNIRVNCAKTLANIKDNSAVNPLLYCLNNKGENYKLRLCCAEALGKIGDKYAIIPLTEVLKDVNEQSVYLKESAVFALGMIGDTKAVDPLVSILETQKGIIDKFTFLKERAIEALSKININTDRVFKALKKSLNDESIQVRINAIEALSNLDNKEVPDLLYSCLKDPSEEVVKNAIIALFNILGEEILYKILNDSSLPEHTMRQIREVIKEIEDCDNDDEFGTDDE